LNDEADVWESRESQERAAYGISAGGETWSASGPFSGCQIVIGQLVDPG